MTSWLTLDESGNVTARRTRAGQTLTYAYDDLDQLREKVSPSPAVTTDWTYLLDGRIDTICTTVTCGTGGDVIDYNYDSAARLKQVRTKIPGLTIKVTNYTLDANGNRTQLQWPDGYAVGYCYDSLNRMTAAWDNAACTDPDPNKRLALYSYDPLSRRTNLAYAGGAGASFSYGYSDAGDLLTLKHITAGGPQYTLTYTPAHQLETETLNNANFVWQPTATGSTSYGAANTLNQYPTVAGVTQSYDANGNLTGDGTASFTYDAENRLLTASKTGLAATYQYDPLGRRTRKSGTGVTDTIYLSDGTDEIAEYDRVTGTLTTRYIPGPGIDQTIAMVDATGAKSFFHTNRQGSLVAATDPANTRTEGPYTYDPYGNCFRSALPCATLATTIPYKYTGRRLDPETGLYYYRARYYDPSKGRFLQTDPVGYDADMNLYTYAHNDPTDLTDPKGTFGLGVDAIFGDVEVGYDYPSGQFFIAGRVGFNLPPGPYLDLSPSSIPSGVQQSLNACEGCRATWSNVSGSAGAAAGPYYWMPISYEGDTDVTTYRPDGSIQSSHEDGSGFSFDPGRVGNSWDKANQPKGRKGNPLGSHKHPRMKNPFIPSGGVNKEWGRTATVKDVANAIGNAFSNLSDKPGQSHLCTGSLIPTQNACGGF